MCAPKLARQQITSAIRDELNHTQFVDAVCYGGDKPFCGEARAECKPGSHSEHLGLAPCKLCPQGTWQSASKATACISCEAQTNTSKRGAKAAVCLRSVYVFANALARLTPACGPPPRIPLGLAAVRGGFGPVRGRFAAAHRKRACAFDPR